MKKLLAIILTVCVIVCSFAACSSSKKAEDKTKKTEKTTVSTTAEITTDDAKITEADAVNLIKKQYTAKELGLSQEDYENGSFMISSSGVEYDGNYYVKVINAIKQEHKDDDGNVTYTFDTKGEYLISYDGKTILQKDMKAEKETYKKMEVREVPSTTLPENEKKPKE